MLKPTSHYWSSLLDDEKNDFKFLYVSTVLLYGSLGEKGYFTEVPNSLYSASKAVSEHLVKALHHTCGLLVLTTNCSNNYRPYQFPEKLIPVILFNALEGKDFPVYGDGSNIRDWLCVEDHCKAIHKGNPKKKSR